MLFLMRIRIIHILLVVAVIMFLIRLIQGRKVL
jgi:uncharacterized membrane protein YtjA (UPF0391 family)